MANNKTAPCTIQQQSLWFLDALIPASKAYQTPHGYRLRGPLEPSILESALQELLWRHESLRTTIGAQDGQPLQIIHAPRPWKLPVIDLAILPIAERELELHRFAREELLEPFDLERGALFRVYLIRLGSEDHALLLNLHHVISDGWSHGVLWRQLSQLYSSRLQGDGSAPEIGIGAAPAITLPKQEQQYVDFAKWQQAWMQSDEFLLQLSFWRAHLAEPPAPLDLPSDRRRPVAPYHAGAECHQMVPEALVRTLETLSRSESATVFMTMLAAFYVLLHRYTGMTDLVVGVPMANRTRPQFHDVVGLFVNTLPFRANLAGNPTFRDLLAQIRTLSMNALANQIVPLEKLVEELQPPRAANRHPLFQVALAFQNLPQYRESPYGLSVEPLLIPPGSTAFDLEMVVEPTTDGMRLTARYSTELFEQGAINRLIGHYLRLLEGIAADPEQRLADLPLLTAGEERQILLEWNQQVEVEADGCMHELFEAQARLRPEAIAVRFRNETMTYGALNARANQLAHRLRSLEVGPEALVGVSMGRSIDLVAALLGVLKTGAAYVPMDPHYPDSRLGFLLHNTGAKLVVTDASASERFQRLAAGVDVIAMDAAGTAEQPVHDPGVRVHPSQAMYVIHTSGSTGQPKGVVISHANVRQLFAATARTFGFDEKDVWTLFHSFAFDLSVWELWGALAFGGRLIVVPGEAVRDPDEFYQLLAREGATVLSQTPSAFYRFVQAMPRQQVSEGLCLRLVIFAGEVLDFARLQPWLQRNGDHGPQLVNMYGITETTVHVTERRITRDEIENETPSLIGKPLAGWQVYILDADLHLTPVGIPGELCVGGAGLARSYLGQPALTAARFVPHPFACSSGGRLYRSGDVARWRADGDIQYLGRKDDQVKIRGFRVELAEVEAALAAHPGLDGCTVVAYERPSELSGDPATTELAAYIVPVGSTGPSIADLNRFLRSRLPEHMVPSRIVYLETMPLTQNGKVDRRALPPPDPVSTGVEAMKEPSEPTKATESKFSDAELNLMIVWEEILGVSEIGIHDNFFELGGHSLLAMQLVNRLRLLHMAEIPVSIVFDAPTITEMAAFLDLLQ